jgi:uncharacterized small protein (DUF1192 family)
MDWDDVRMKPARQIVIGEELRTFSIGELEARVVALAAEIDRIKAEIATKRAHTAAAADVFKQ